MATVVQGYPKAPFSIATTLRCRGGHYSFPWIAPLYPSNVPYNAKVLSKEVSSTTFWVFVMTQPEIEPQSPGPLANSLSLSQWAGKIIIIDKYLDLAKELKKPWNMEGMVIPIVVGTRGTVTKGFKKRLEELEIRWRIETI